MAIRKNVDAPKIAPTKQKPVVSEPAGPSLDDVKSAIERAFQDRNFSQSEVKRLEDLLKGAPKSLVEGARDHLSKRLEEEARTAKGPIAISEAGLSKLSGLVGVDLKDLFFRRQLQSEKVDRSVSQGLEKTAQTVEDTHDAGKQKQASDNRLEKQKAILDQKNGVVERPVGGSKGAAYDAALVLGEHLEGKLDEKLGVEAKAAKDVLREPLIKTSTQVLAEMQRSGSLDKLGEVVGAIGSEGFKETLSQAASAVGNDILNATNLTSVNTEAVGAFVSGTTASVDKIGKLVAGTKLEGVVATHGAKLAKGVTELGAKVGVAAKTTETAATLAKGAQTATAVAEGAQAATVVAEGAQVAGAGAKVAGQSVPVLGQALGVVTTGLATCECISHCAHKPRDWKRIIASAANVVGQAVGIFVPFVGAGATVAKLAADAAMNADDKKHGKETHQAGVQQIAPHVSNATSFVSPFLEGAGYGEAAGKMREYNSYVTQMAEKGVTSVDFAKMDAAERDAMLQQMGAAHQELEKLRPEAKGTPNEAALTLAGSALQQMMALWRKSKNVANAENPDAEAKKLQGEAMEAAAKATAAQAVADST